MAKDEPELIDPESVASIFLAECLAMTPQAVSKLAAEGVIKNNGRRGKYKLTDAVPAYVSSVRRSGTAEAGARHKLQQERKLRLANDKEEGRLVVIEDAAEAFRQYCLIWRAGANALPRRLATQLSNETNPTKIQRLLTNEFAELFETMESGLREYFVSTGETFAVTETRPSGKGTAAAKNARPMGRRKKNTTVRKRGAGKVAK